MGLYQMYWSSSKKYCCCVKTQKGIGLFTSDLLERPLTKEEIKLLKEIVEEESVRLKGEE